MCISPRDLRIVHFQIHLGIFKNSVTFKILTNMFRQYIRHRHCDCYESLQLIKCACYNARYTNLHYIVLENNTLHKFKVSKMNRCACTHL